MAQVSQDKFVEFCLQVTSGLAQIGVTKFSFQIQTEHLKYFVNTDPSNVDVDKNMKKKKNNKSPSAKRKNQIRLEHFLFKKLFNTDSAKSDQTTSADPDPKDDTQEDITCQNCG